MKDVYESICVVLGSILFVIVLCFISAWVVSMCWNYIMPYLFGLPTITYWQAFVIQILCGCLFKNNISSTRDKEKKKL